MDAHDGQAGWFQAVFSVIAILAAIWIDRGTARRAAVEKRVASEKLHADRVLAIKYCASALRDMGRLFESATIDHGPVGLTDEELRYLEVTQRAIDFYVANPGDVGPDLMGTMAYAQNVLADGRRAIDERNNSFSSEPVIRAMAKAMRGRAEAIAEILATHEGTRRFRAHAGT